MADLEQARAMLRMAHKDFNALIGIAMAKLRGKADGKKNVEMLKKMHEASSGKK